MPVYRAGCSPTTSFSPTTVLLRLSFPATIRVSHVSDVWLAGLIPTKTPLKQVYLLVEHVLNAIASNSPCRVASSCLSLRLDTVVPSVSSCTQQIRAKASEKPKAVKWPTQASPLFLTAVQNKEARIVNRASLEKPRKERARALEVPP